MTDDNNHRPSARVLTDEEFASTLRKLRESHRLDSPEGGWEAWQQRMWTDIQAQVAKDRRRRRLIIALVVAIDFVLGAIGSLLLLRYWR